MGEWVIGAFINFFGSIAINFGTNLLKLGHNEVLYIYIYFVSLELLFFSSFFYVPIVSLIILWLIVLHVL